MQGYVYILKFDKDGRFYIGSTNNLGRRLKQHRQGAVPSTKYQGSFRLAFSQKVQSLKIARSAERKIKSWKRKDFIEKIIVDGKIAFLDKHDEHP